MTNLDIVLKTEDIALPEKVPIVKATRFASSHVWMWELDHKKGWAPKKWCLRIVVLEKTLESPLDYKEKKLLNPKGNQPWTFIERIDDVAPVLWPPDAKNWLIGKDTDVEKDWRQKEKRVAEDEMVR